MDEPTPPLPETVDPAHARVVPPSTCPSAGSESALHAKTLPFSDDRAEAREASTPDTLPSTPAPSHPCVPGYEVLGVLGRGGMGVVYQAREVALDRVVALKMVLAGAHAGPEQLARFRAEAQAEARLQHPNIVQVYAIGDHDGLPYFALEYVAGGNLARQIARQPQQPDEAAQLIETLARALHYAHQRGIVHRDLKPANVLLTPAVATSGPLVGSAPPTSGPLVARAGAGWTPKIADFGLAKRLEDESGPTRTGSLLGTPDYMAPEQAEGRVRDIGPATDVYALGVILYELLSGRPPFHGLTMMDTLEQVRTREPVPPGQLQPKVPADLETICLKCLHKEPSRRYPSAEALAEDCAAFLRGDPIKARPIGSLERFGRWCRRNPRLAGLSAAVLLLLVIVAVTSTVFALLLGARQRETEKARQEADRSAREAQDRYRLAVDALNAVVGKVHGRLEKTPATSRVRQEIVEAALEVLKECMARKDPQGLAERGAAGAHMILGDIFWERGQRPDAVKHYDECHALLAALYRANPDSDKDAGNFAASLSRQADMALDFRRQPAARAREMYQEALTIQEGLLAHPPPRRELTTAEIQRSAANSHQRLAEILLRTGGPATLTDAEDHLQKARDLLEQSVRAEVNPVARQKLDEVCFRLGQTNERMGRPAEARKAYDRCLEFRTQFVADNPSSTRAKESLLGLCGAVGDQLLMSGDSAAARRYYRAALAPNEHLARTDDRPVVRNTLSQNYYRMATACLRLGEATEADTYYQKCRKVRARLLEEYPNNVNYQVNLMIAQARCGLHREAVAAAEGLRRRFPKDPRWLVQAACCCALCGPAVARGEPEGEMTTEERRLRETYLVRAVDALRQAKANGYMDVPTLKVDPDLDPLRQRDDFRQLLREFGAGLSGPPK